MGLLSIDYAKNLNNIIEKLFSYLSNNIVNTLILRRIYFSCFIFSLLNIFKILNVMNFVSNITFDVGFKYINLAFCNMRSKYILVNCDG